MDSEAFGAATPVIGMVHLPPLPGAPRYDREAGREPLHEAARRDARRLAEGGVDAVLVENYGDVPFYPDDVPAHVVAELTALTRSVRDAVELPVGVNVLRNDAEAAVAVAAAGGADFVRVNIHVGVRVTDQGLVEGQAHETLRLRDRIGADVRVLADIDVKHSVPVTERSPGDALAEAVERGLADGVIVSGDRTGGTTPRSAVEAAVAQRDDRGLDVPVLVGSGVTADSVADLLRVADGVVVGTALKEGAETTNPVSVGRVAELVDAADRARS